MKRISSTSMEAETQMHSIETNEMSSDRKTLKAERRHLADHQVNEIDKATPSKMTTRSSKG